MGNGWKGRVDMDSNCNCADPAVMTNLRVKIFGLREAIRTSVELIDGKEYEAAKLNLESALAHEAVNPYPDAGLKLIEVMAHKAKLEARINPIQKPN